MCRKTCMITCVQILGACASEIWGQENVQNFTQFRTTLKFDREYIRDGWRYKQVESGINNKATIPSTFGEKNIMNLGPLTTKLTRLMFTYPKSTVRAISDNSTIRSRISLDRIKRSTSGKRHYQLWSLPRSTKKVVDFGPLTRKFTRLMVTQPKWTLRVLCRLLQLHSPGGVRRSKISTT